jgi:hypothetical protein
VLGSAALHDAVFEAALEPVVVDVAGQRFDLDPADAARLRDAAAALAGTSSVARDLSVLLGHALQRRRVLALHRSEAQALLLLASEVGLDALAREIAA